MTCPKRNKNCTPIKQKWRGKSYICGGMNKKPTKYKEDILWLCFKNTYCKVNHQFMPDEALDVVEVLIETLKNHTIKSYQFVKPHPECEV